MKLSGLTTLTAASALALATLVTGPASADNIGNSCSTATPINNGQTLRATIDPNPSSKTDTDYYAFRIPVGTRYWVTVDLTEVPKDYDLFLSDDDDSYGEFHSTNPGTSPERVEALMYGQSSPYCFWVENSDGEFDRVAKYAVTLSFKEVPADNGPDSRNLAAPLIPGVPVSETLEDGNDYDWYTFSLGTQSDVAVDLTSPVSDNDLSLYETDSNWSIASSSNSGTSPDRIAERLDAGTYWVRVNGDGELWTPYSLVLSTSAVPTRPSRPALMKRKSKKSVVVYWNPLTEATAYQVKRGKKAWATTGRTWTSVSKKAAKRHRIVLRVRGTNSAGAGKIAKVIL